MKSLVIAHKPQTLDQFEVNVRRIITDRRQQLLDKVGNWRLHFIQPSDGAHIPEIMFNTNGINKAYIMAIAIIFMFYFKFVNL